MSQESSSFNLPSVVGSFSLPPVVAFEEPEEERIEFDDEDEYEIEEDDLSAPNTTGRHKETVATKANNYKNNKRKGPPVIDVCDENPAKKTLPSSENPVGDEYLFYCVFDNPAQLNKLITVMSPAFADCSLIVKNDSAYCGITMQEMHPNRSIYTEARCKCRVIVPASTEGQVVSFGIKTADLIKMFSMVRKEHSLAVYKLKEGDGLIHYRALNHITNFSLPDTITDLTPNEKLAPFDQKHSYTIELEMDSLKRFLNASDTVQASVLNLQILVDKNDENKFYFSLTCGIQGNMQFIYLSSRKESSFVRTGENDDIGKLFASGISVTINDDDQTMSADLSGCIVKYDGHFDIGYIKTIITKMSDKCIINLAPYDVYKDAPTPMYLQYDIEEDVFVRYILSQCVYNKAGE